GTVAILSSLHHFLNEQLRYQEAEQVAQEALTMAAQQPTLNPEVPNILHRLADAAIWNHDYVKAERLANESVNLHRELHGNNHLETAWGLRYRGIAQQRQGKLVEAETSYREALAIYRRLFDDVTKVNPWLVRNLAEIFVANGNKSGLNELRAMLSTAD